MSYMEKVYEILDKLKRQEPVALARFNDGEMSAIMNPAGTVTVARGDQFVGLDLRHRLLAALTHEQENYYKGIPCKNCYPKFHQQAKQLVGDYKYLTYAVVNTNRNWQYFRDNLGDAIGDRRVIWVSGQDQNVNALKNFGIEVDKHIKLPTKNAFSRYEEIRDMRFIKGDVVLLSCGPIGRVLVWNWFMENPQTNFLEIGSTFDPYTRDVWHRCHLGTLPKCEECN